MHRTPILMLLTLALVALVACGKADDKAPASNGDAPAGSAPPALPQEAGDKLGDMKDDKAGEDNEKADDSKTVETDGLIPPAQDPAQGATDDAPPALQQDTKVEGAGQGGGQIGEGSIGNGGQGTGTGTGQGGLGAGPTDGKKKDGKKPGDKDYREEFGVENKPAEKVPAF